MTKESSYYGGSGTEIVSGAPTTAQWNTFITSFETLQNKVSALEALVGGESSGLTKDVADLQTVVGDASAGLVKRVSDLESAAETTEP